MILNQSIEAKVASSLAPGNDGFSSPRWLGYFIQRPESHSRHHARGVHANNYSDLPIFDLLFGTFDNPREFAAETGFYDGASARVVEMLCGRDVAEPGRAQRFGDAMRPLSYNND